MLDIALNKIWVNIWTTFIRTERRAADNSTYPKGGVLCSKDSFVVNGSLVFQFKFWDKSTALRVAPKRQPNQQPIPQ